MIDLSSSVLLRKLLDARCSATSGEPLTSSLVPGAFIVALALSPAYIYNKQISHTHTHTLSHTNRQTKHK